MTEGISKEFHLRIFQKPQTHLADNILVVENSEHLQISKLWSREFIGYGELNQQPTLVLTEDPGYWKTSVSKTLKKNNVDYALDHSKYIKDPINVEIFDLKELEKENFIDLAIEAIVDYHDNKLENPEDNRLIRIFTDSAKLLDARFFHNMKVYGRKTNISFFMSVDLCQKVEAIRRFFMYFDKVFELSEVDSNIPNTIGVAKVHRSEEIDSFTPGEVWGLANDKALFWGLEKHHNLVFRDIDVTDVL